MERDGDGDDWGIGHRGSGSAFAVVGNAVTGDFHFMCIILFADQAARVPMLLESFHPVQDPDPNPNPSNCRAIFEQAYDVLLKNVSRQPITKLVFGHPRNTLSQAKAPAVTLQLPQHPEWLGERMFRDRVSSTPGGVEFDLWFPQRAPHHFGPVDQLRPTAAMVTIHRGMAALCGYSEFIDLLNEGLPTFFEVALRAPILPGGSLLLSLSFPGQYVFPLIKRPINQPAKQQTFALVCPSGVWDRFEQTIARHTGDPDSPLHRIAQRVDAQVRTPVNKLWTTSIDELRIAVLSDSRHLVYESREHGEKITFWEIRRLRDDVIDPFGEPMSAHIWYASGRVEHAEFEVFFSVHC